MNRKTFLTIDSLIEFIRIATNRHAVVNIHVKRKVGINNEAERLVSNGDLFSFVVQ